MNSCRVPLFAPEQIYQRDSQEGCELAESRDARIGVASFNRNQHRLADFGACCKGVE